jgi:hypothetical protein
MRCFLFLLMALCALPGLRPLTLTFSGDIMAHDVNIFRSSQKNVYTAIKPLLAAADLNFANFETTLDEDIDQQGYPRFNVHRAYAAAAVEAGFNVFSLANNHMADHGPAGVAASRAAWADLAGSYPSLRYSGFKDEADEPAVLSFNEKGYRIAFIALTEFVNWAETGDIGQNQINIVNFRDDIAVSRLLVTLKAARQEHDLLIVSYHGGTEYVTALEPEKNRFLKRLIDEGGADIVWAHHPHVLQPWEYYKGKLIINSAGNLISGQIWRLNSSDYAAERAYTGDSALFWVEITGKKKTLRLETAVFPLSNYKHPRYGMVIIRLDRLNAEALPDMPVDWLFYYSRRLQQLQPLLKPYQADYHAPTP